MIARQAPPANSDMRLQRRPRYLVLSRAVVTRLALYIKGGIKTQRCRCRSMRSCTSRLLRFWRTMRVDRTLTTIEWSFLYPFTAIVLACDQILAIFQWSSNGFIVRTEVVRAVCRIIKPEKREATHRHRPRHIFVENSSLPTICVIFTQIHDVTLNSSYQLLHNRFSYTVISLMQSPRSPPADRQEATRDLIYDTHH